MEHGFFHPDRGYWQTTGEPAQNILDGYPEGTVEVPLKPKGGFDWDGSEWVEVAPPAWTVANVKAEASRRILAICPEWKQRNLTAQAAILAAKGRDNWTTEDQAAWDAGEAIWTQIAAIRAASDTLEAVDPIPNPRTWEGWP